MNLYIDTSALVKFFHNENGTEKITELISSDNRICISELAKIEFFSSLYRKYRAREIDDKMLALAIEGFEEQINKFLIEPIKSIIIKEAELLLKKHGQNEGLRTLDSIHLATFSLISEKNWIFVASDKRLCDIAEKLNFEIINPLS